MTQKAMLYANNRRSGLCASEITQLIQEQRGIYLGATDVDFLLVWDHHKERPSVLLLARGRQHDTVVSIWGPHYYGIPNGPPTDRQITDARSCALR
jgi:hypothetical protein